MDMIYAKPNGEDIGYLEAASIDMAYGDEENDFSVIIDTAHHCCGEWYRIYAEGSEFGGVVEDIMVDSGTDTVTYKGKTWHGIMAAKVIEPPAGSDYYTASGDLNEIIEEVITGCGLSDLFTAASTASGFSVSWQFDRYVDCYKGLKKMAEKNAAKICMRYDGEIGKVVVAAKTASDFSQNEEWDSSQMSVRLTKSVGFTNHLICLGAGELKDRLVLHLYADEDRGISTTQSITGIYERTAVYDYPNCSDEHELLEKGASHFEDLIKYETLDNVSIENGGEEYDVGDIVGVRENVTGIFVVKKITKKILRITDYEEEVTYEVGG